MENDSGMSDGKKHFENVKSNIPFLYRNSVMNIEYVRGGRVYERMLKQILQDALRTKKDEIDDKLAPIFPIERGGKKGGYLKPDLHLKDKNVYIEVTTWGDSNMIFSKIMQGYLIKQILKQKNSESRYYVVIAGLYIENGWTWDDVKYWETWSRIGNVQAVDGWFGFKNIGDLVEKIREVPL